MGNINLLTVLIAAGSLASVTTGLLFAFRERFRVGSVATDAWEALVDTEQFRSIVEDLAVSLSAERETLDKLQSIVAPRVQGDNYISYDARVEITEHIDVLRKHLETQSAATRRLEGAVAGPT